MTSAENEKHDEFLPRYVKHEEALTSLTAPRPVREGGSVGKSKFLLQLRITAFPPEASYVTELLR